MDVWNGWLVASFYIISFIYFSIKRKDADLISLIIPVLVLGNFFLLIFIIYSQVQCKSLKELFFRKKFGMR